MSEYASAVPKERVAEVCRARFGPEAVSLLPQADSVTVSPRSVEQVAEVLAVARDLGVQVSPAGGPILRLGASGVVLDLGRLSSIVELKVEDMLAVVQAGVRVRDLAAAAEAVGLHYPPALLEGRESSVGGSLARAGGTRGPVYGPARDYVLGLRAVLPSGELLGAGSRAIKNATGYNLTQLMVGSWGALGVIVEATLRLMPKPALARALAAGAPDVPAAIGAAASLCGELVPPVAVELLDRRSLGKMPELGALLAGDPGAALLVLLEGGDQADLDERTRRAREVVQQATGASAEVVPSEVEPSVWDARRGLPEALAREDRCFALLELAAPLGQTARLASQALELASSHGLDVALFGSAGVGSLSVAVLADEAEQPAATALCRGLVSQTLGVGGNLAGVRAAGLSYSEWLDLSLAAPVAAALRQVKAALDPSGLLRPAMRW